MSIVNLPDGRTLTLAGDQAWPKPANPPASRIAYAAAHVVADPRAENAPGAPAVLDWETTLAFRHHLWSHGFGVAEAMDTAQRGMGLDYAATRELIRRSAASAAAAGGRIVAGVATDQLPPGPATLDQVRAAYAEQLADVLTAGAAPVLMCSRHMAATAQHADDYLSIYRDLLEQSDKPVVLHWLGTAFDPALEGYWGSSDVDKATETVLELINANPAKVDGIKISLLDADHEIRLRRRLPAGVRLYTGDDFNYPELIRGDDQGYSDALLGIFAAIAPAAAAALAALDRGELDEYDRIFAPTVPLSRHIFKAPTFYYKTGIVFLAWLAGHQKHFTMVGGLQSGRSVPHFAKLIELADAAGLLPDPSLAAHRANRFFEVVAG
ncbi:dihydrodipicolinate synthase family protein [Actinoplanes aureus]|uniref:Dihydrodipicolinate synthase family protein n=1 Tax=Actinoplanes aureus TaxID=2792083 RepID=A0A931C9J7_9ACTN|nr:dihydrodipicolinate synthase family protein [Actinoplanes aureus]MBG0560845.1 dihydrodipicolinate synthase family protein [Actinoplanes aureus]